MVWNTTATLKWLACPSGCETANPNIDVGEDIIGNHTNGRLALAYTIVYSVGTDTVYRVVYC